MHRNLFNSYAFSTANQQFSTTTEQDPSSIRVNRFHTGIFVNPHAAKKAKGGEDAAAVTDNLVALADGVGGWAESGIDPANYSRRLCSLINDFATKDKEDKYMMNPAQLLVDAVDQNNEIGSCTCVLTSLDKEAPVVYTANLGDSGYLLLRKSGVDLISIFRTKEQTHSFNFPW